MAQKECALCDTIINPRMAVCRAHLADYEKYKNEEWFRFLVNDKDREYRQDMRQDTLIEEGDVNLPMPYTKLTETEIKNIFELRQAYGWGAKRISDYLNISEFAVKYQLQAAKKGRSSYSKVREKMLNPVKLSTDDTKSADD